MVKVLISIPQTLRGCHHPQFPQPQLFTAHVPQIVGHDGLRAARQRQFDQMVVRFIGQVGPPPVIRRYPAALPGQRRQHLLPLVCAGPLAPHGTAQQILIFRPQCIAKQRLKLSF